MADFVVTYSVLEQAEKTLEGLKNEFDGIKGQEQAYAGAYGSGDVAGAMNDFADNWSYHRGKITESMDALAKSVHTVLDQVPKCDADMANQLTGKK